MFFNIFKISRLTPAIFYIAPFRKRMSSLLRSRTYTATSALHAIDRCRIIELWSNYEETEAGIEVAGEQNFRAITCTHTNMMVERIVDYSALGRGQNWSAILHSRIREVQRPSALQTHKPGRSQHARSTAFELVVQQEL